MKLKGITDEDFVNYKLPSMFIATACCSFKCDINAGMPICQNSKLVQQPTHDLDDKMLVERYKHNPITKAIVFGGLEPFDQYGELRRLIGMFCVCGVKDDIVIYTGYNKDEVDYFVDQIVNDFGGPLVVKYGRYIPNQEPHLDPVLGVMLASDNQYAERING